MQDLNDLRIFTEVVEQGGFSAAARKLGMPRSKVSRRMAVLEKNLGIRLIQRTTRQFQVSDVGHEYYSHCRAMMIEAAAAQGIIDRTQAEPQGTIRISCPSAVIYSKVGQIIAQFMMDYPKTSILLESTNRQVDIIREGFDICVRVTFEPLESSGLTVKKLAERPQVIVASPALIKSLKRDIQIDNIAEIPSLAWSSPGHLFEWKLTYKGKETRVIKHNPRYVSEDLVALRMAALAGAGVCQLPEYVVRGDLKEGTLLAVLPEWLSRTSLIYAVFPSRRGLLPAVRGFLDALANNFQV